MLTTEALVKLKVGRVIEGADERRLPLAFTSFRGSRTENPKPICVWIHLGISWTSRNPLNGMSTKDYFIKVFTNLLTRFRN